MSSPIASGNVVAMLTMTQESPEVFYTAEPLVLMGPAELAFLKQRAGENPRQRSRLCTHATPADSVHEMIIVHHRDCYVRPHRHRTNGESLHVVEGAATVVTFDDFGKIMGVFGVSEAGSGVFYYRMPRMQFHTLLIASEWFIFHETTSGPFVRENTEFPAWAADGSNPEQTDAFLNGLRDRVRRWEGSSIPSPD